MQNIKTAPLTVAVVDHIRRRIRTYSHVLTAANSEIIRPVINLNAQPK